MAMPRIFKEILFVNFADNFSKSQIKKQNEAGCDKKMMLWCFNFLVRGWVLLYELVKCRIAV
jgi:hypothetical protein